MTYLDVTNQEYGIRRTVTDDPRNTGRYTAKVFCAVTNKNLVGAENIDDLDRAKSCALDLAKRYH